MPEVKPGQRFRDTQRTAFGGAAPDWIVAQVFVGTDGKQYAQQVYLANDPREKKTLSTAVLSDKRRFVEVR